MQQQQQQQQKTNMYNQMWNITDPIELKLIILLYRTLDIEILILCEILSLPIELTLLVPQI